MSSNKSSEYSRRLKNHSTNDISQEQFNNALKSVRRFVERMGIASSIPKSDQDFTEERLVQHTKAYESAAKKMLDENGENWNTKEGSTAVKYLFQQGMISDLMEYKEKITKNDLKKPYAQSETNRRSGRSSPPSSISK